MSEKAKEGVDKAKEGAEAAKVNVSNVVGLVVLLLRGRPLYDSASPSTARCSPSLSPSPTSWRLSRWGTALLPSSTSSPPQTNAL